MAASSRGRSRISRRRPGAFCMAPVMAASGAALNPLALRNDHGRNQGRAPGQGRCLLRRSADDMAALLDPDFVYVNAGGYKLDKAQYIDNGCTSGRTVFRSQ